MLIRLNVIDREGNKSTIEAEEGTTIRQAIMDKLSPSNYGLCEGNCICGTCQVQLSSSDLDKLKTASEDETMTMETSAIKPSAHSRLGCQISLTKEINNLTVTIAPD